MSDVKIVSTTKAPAAIGPYVQGKIVNGFLFASGQIPLVPSTGALAEGRILYDGFVLNNKKSAIYVHKTAQLEVL